MITTPTQIRIDVAYPEEVCEYKPEVIEAMKEAKKVSRDPDMKSCTDV